MPKATRPIHLDLRRPIAMGSHAFARQKYAFYRAMLEEAPVCRASILGLRFFAVAGYEDCKSLLTDPRFVRSRTTATGGSRFPFPVPRSVSLLAESMILEDDPAHRRLRALVNKAFTPGAVARLAGRIEALTHELYDAAEMQGEVDLKQAYALPIPSTIIGEIVGVPEAEMPELHRSVRILSSGLSGFGILRTLLFDLRRAARFMTKLVERKRADPQDDILSALIEAEEDGDQLSEHEILSMLFLLVVAGFETTYNLITNGVLTLLDHPDQLERLRAEPELLDSAIEEILRHRGPVHGTKLCYATEEVSVRGVCIPKGSPAMPLLAAANHDPAVFEKPDCFDIGRSPNRHLAFGHGAHFCLGAQLARLETRLALQTLLARSPKLRLAVPREEIQPQAVGGWHRYPRLPVALV